MNKFFARYLKRVLPLGLAVSAAAVLLMPAAANATPYVVKLVEQGTNVVATGSGAFDLTDLTSNTSFIGNWGYSAALGPTYPDISLGPSSNYSLLDAYTGFTGPSNFGVGPGAFTNNGTGNVVEISNNSDQAALFVPGGYVSGTALTSGATWNNASFASFGVTPGTYVWTWGEGRDQSFTLDIGNAVSVPEPAALGMFSFGVLLLGAFVGLRRRVA